MGVFRFRRTFKIAPGVRFNLSKSGASVSFGPRGLHYTVGPKGTRTTAGLPGSGISWTEYQPYSSRRGSEDSNVLIRSISSEAFCSCGGAENVPSLDVFIRLGFRLQFPSRLAHRLSVTRRSSRRFWPVRRAKVEVSHQLTDDQEGANRSKANANLAGSGMAVFRR
jgi:hypothetical protein